MAAPSAAARRRAGQVNLHSVLEDGSHAVRQVLLQSLCVGSQSSQAWNGQEQTVATCGPRDHGSGVVSVVRTPRLGNTISATKEDAGASHAVTFIRNCGGHHAVRDRNQTTVTDYTAKKPRTSANVTAHVSKVTRYWRSNTGLLHRKTRMAQKRPYGSRT